MTAAVPNPPPAPKPPAGPSTPKPPAGPKSPHWKAEALLTVKELAALWRCSPCHIYDLIADGELAAVQISKGRAKTRIPESAAAEYVARQLRTRRAAA